MEKLREISREKEIPVPDDIRAAFAAKDPVRVLPILMVGSSISAIATYIMKVQVPAPHGGFLILPLVHPAITWVLCILAGSVVGAILYVLTAKDVEE